MPQAKDSDAVVEQLASLQCRLSLKGVAKKTLTDLAGKMQAVLPLSTVKRFLEANKFPYKEGRPHRLTQAPGRRVRWAGRG